MAMHGTAVQLSLGTYVNTLFSVSKYPHKNWPGTHGPCPGTGGLDPVFGY